MSSTFWTNTIWYMILGIVTLFQLVFVMIKAKHRRETFAFFLTIFGITLHYELMLLVFMKAYTYYPMIIKNAPTPFDDSLAGNLFSQFAISTTILLVVVLNLRWYWFLLLAVIYGFIEESFLALGIYSQHWYRTWMTVLILPFAFWASKKMYAEITRGIKPITYYGFIYLGLFPLHISTIIWAFMLSGHLEFSRTVLSDPISSRHLMVMVLFFLLFIPMMLLYFLRLKRVWKALIIFILYLIYYYMYKTNLIWIKEGWFLLVSTITMLWMYLSVAVMDRLYGGQK